jgi:hypothetical protein
MTRPPFDELDAPPDHSGSEEIFVYFDTEFSDMLNPQLLSIGLVVDSGQEIYIEVAGAREMVVSDFVRREVFPLFGLHDPVVLAYDAIATYLEHWFDELRGGHRDIGIVLIYDYPTDWQLISELRVPMLGEPTWTRAANVGGRMVQSLMTSGRLVTQYFDAIEEFHREHKQQHHALVDARAMRYAISKMRFE